MSNMLVNTRDQQFVLFEQLGIEKLFDYETFAGFSKDDLTMILNEAEKFAVNVMAPTLVESDRDGCKFKDGKVFAPKCFHEPYKKFIEGGWIHPMDDPDVGGQGIPFSVNLATTELFGAANYSLIMGLFLFSGAAALIKNFGSDEQKEKYMTRLYDGDWAGTMALTEPGAGSDVGALKTSAKRLPDGKYLITGTKCFITSGDHDLTPNIVHPVLARIEGDPSGTKGISIFLVPKYRVNDDGSLGEFNDVKTGGIEHKMGIHGSPTCTLNFGEDGKCIGELLGNERDGIKIMFQLMNESRINSGMQGLDLASASFERAVAYAKERVQGVSIKDGRKPGAQPVTIINHPDIRRRLLWMKSHIEGMRAMCYFGAHCIDMHKAATSEEEKADWEGYLDLLTPVIKAYTTDKGFLCCSLAIDVHGGYGYCAEYPIEQYLRDEKIATIYEGTNAIQAIDLVGRKLSQRGGKNMENLLGKMRNNIAACKNNAELAQQTALLQGAVDAYDELRKHFVTLAKTPDALIPILNASKFMEIMGDVVIGHFLLEAAGIASGKLDAFNKEMGADTLEKQKELQQQNKEAAFYAGKMASAKFFAFDILTTVKARCEAIKMADDTPLVIPEAAFTY